jgi:hypothetical protein
MSWPLWTVATVVCAALPRRHPTKTMIAAPRRNAIAADVHSAVRPARGPIYRSAGGCPGIPLPDNRSRVIRLCQQRNRDAPAGDGQPRTWQEANVVGADAMSRYWETVLSTGCYLQHSLDWMKTPVAALSDLTPSNPERRAQILDAAIDILTDTDIGGVTHRQVDDRAGLPAAAPRRITSPPAWPYSRPPPPAPLTSTGNTSRPCRASSASR